ncbi:MULTISPECIES: SDR family oxidoreductase [Microbacterium]|uniref:SDR family oxidoreductase n=1 Tax=Microbacterium TaxID=33882 RepID=UPI002783CEDF|nr:MULTISPECIES: SDR family oxidoreductase [Microbacterium]MDQ1084902.1 NAD(P)-dependent dehydrogenase (short-subunit alcohol dehydrogenase family) [Microbacterium sp. SORGH_AS_0344]MDQ1169820.1 NAD(P)-dependent dehydrogenase (short-subunit alcohol dehydrogenase family) [Microbacterium proteolyticum]
MTPTSLPLSGRLAVVTGASDGIGTVIATRLAALGAEVVLPVRSADKGRRAIDTLRREVPDAVASTRTLDLASLDSVHTLVETLRGEGRPVHLLVNNAGVMTPPSRRETADGFELQWGTNHLGHAALTLGLLPLLREGRARVVHQTSIAARRGRFDEQTIDPTPYDAMASYVQSKIAIGLFAQELERRSRALGWQLTSTLAHPGVSPTNLLAAQPGVGRERELGARRVIRLLSRLHITGTVASAAEPAVLAATAPASDGTFFGPSRLIGGPARATELWPPFRAEADARRLWDLTTEAVGPRFAV